jgi:hypothetical protein
MKRVLVPELLDSLPAEDPGAVASRRDLRMVNGIMGNFRWLLGQLANVPPDGMVLEIGAGDGSFAQQACRRMPSLAPRYHAIDLAPRPSGWPVEAGWHQADVWSGSAAEQLRQTSVLVANLVLHHFSDAELHRLGELLPACHTILACEPCRRERHVWQGRLLFPFLHRITRHDMVVSIRAGFREDELSAAMGLDPGQWRGAASETWLGAYRFVAVRNNRPKCTP